MLKQDQDSTKSTTGQSSKDNEASGSSKSTAVSKSAPQLGSDFKFLYWEQ